MTSFIPAKLAAQQPVRGGAAQMQGVSQVTMLHYKSDIDKTISVNFLDISLENALHKIARKADLNLTYRGDIMVDKKVTLKDKNITVSGALTRVLQGVPLDYRFSKDRYLLIVPEEGDLKEVANTVSGTVTDAQTGNPLVGVNILVVGTSSGTATDADGHYSLSVPSLQDSLRFSYIGYQTKTVAINGQTTIDITMESKVISGQQVVVTALGQENKKQELSYSTQEIKGKTVQKIKGVNIATSLTGKVAGLKVENSTEFDRSPSITLRGGTPLLVIDGVPYGNVGLNDINADDIKSMNVLKGATATALYGSRGGSGAIIITTKDGSGVNGLSVSINSNTMAFAGYLALPKAQHTYSSGYNGEYNTNDYVWGAYMHGQMEKQWDPIAKKYVKKPLKARGKNNFRGFLRPSYVTNNTISISRGWKNGSIRSSFNYLHKRGQYPNHKLNGFDYSLAGQMEVNDKLSFDGRFNYSRRNAPQIAGIGYGDQGYIYTILVWTGPEYNLSKYKNNYWLKKDEQQNWNRTSWYDNPYMSTNGKIHRTNSNTWNAHLTANYKLFKGANLKLRTGYDNYINEDVWRAPPNILSVRNWRGQSNGLYDIHKANGFSINNDLIFSIKRQFKDISIDGLVGGSIYYYEDKYLGISTRGGLNIPGFYSLANSAERPGIVGNSDNKKQVNSLYAKATIGYQDKIFLNVTGRNDWSSTLPKSTRSYFYPSAGLSFVLSNMLSLPQWLDYWNVRGGFTISKNDLGVYATNVTYSTTTDAWNGLNSADHPNIIRGSDVQPETQRSYELGTEMDFLHKRLSLDLTYYDKYTYNQQANAAISDASGFAYKLINTNETYNRRGWEVTLGSIPVRTKDFRWNVNINWSTTKTFYSHLDSVYSPDKYWVKSGKRTDAYTTHDWERSPKGKIINRNGFPVKSDYPTKIGYSEPNWIWGMTNMFHYKDFSLTISLDGRTGGLMFNSTDARMWESGSNPASVNKYRYQEVVNNKLTFAAPGVKVLSGSVKRDKYGRIIEDNRKFAPNDKKVSYETYVGRWWSGRQEIREETFFKIRNISLKYSLPQKIVNKWGIKKASVAITGQNVLLWTKEFKYADPDPDTDDLNSPSIRYFGIDIGLTF